MNTNLTVEFLAVDPVDLKNYWKWRSKQLPDSAQTAVSVSMYRDVVSRSNPRSVWARASMIWRMDTLRLLEDWKHDGQFDDIVFDVIARFPMDSLRLGQRNIAPFDEILSEIKKTTNQAK
jgi:hypothetical protein